MTSTTGGTAGTIENSSGGSTTGPTGGTGGVGTIVTNGGTTSGGITSGGTTSQAGVSGTTGGSVGGSRGTGGNVTTSISETGGVPGSGGTENSSGGFTTGGTMATGRAGGMKTGGSGGAGGTGTGGTATGGTATGGTGGLAAGGTGGLAGTGGVDGGTAICATDCSATACPTGWRAYCDLTMRGCACGADCTSNPGICGARESCQSVCPPDGTCVCRGSCGTEGQIGYFRGCCPGLVEISYYQDTKACTNPPGTSMVVCTTCGDKICGLGENRCNCPQDCP